ncbi:MAG: hypothetical protein HPY69_05755 [Armatimonadetes bacterium]|nr:hypothetical protein [Armatimonadota bacterium]
MGPVLDGLRLLLACAWPIGLFTGAMGLAAGGEVRVGLENRWLRREFATAPDWRTVSYRAADGGHELVAWAGAPDEGGVTVGGSVLAIGGEGAEDLRLARWPKPLVLNDRQRLRAEFRAACGLEAELTYDLFHRAPVLVKSIRLLNAGIQPLTVDALTLESYQVVPQGSGGLHLVGPTRLDPPLGLRLEPGQSYDFPGHACWQFVLPDGDPEARGLALRRAMRVVWPWTNQRQLMAGFRPARPLESTEPLWTFARQAAEAGFRATWIHHCGSPPVLFTNFADYELDRKLWPGGWRDVRRFTDWCHTHGMKVFFYVTHTAVWWNPGVSGSGVAENRVFREHRWNRVDAQGKVLAPTRDNPGNWTENACPASGWGAFLLERVREAVERGGFDGYDLDGPYDYWQSSPPGFWCYAEDHGHPPGGGCRLPAWANTIQLYRQARARGLFLPTAAGPAHLAAGASRVAGSGAYEGSDTERRAPWHYAWWSRGLEYDSLQLWNPCQLCKVINLIPWLGGLSLSPLEENLDLYNMHLGSAFGYGFDGMPSGELLWEGPGSEAVLKRWTRFYRDYERFFAEGDLLHVRRPDGIHLDAVAHVLPGDPTRALVVAYNPTDREQSDAVRLPFGYAELPDAGWRSESGGEGGTFRVLPGGRLWVKLGPRGVGWCTLRLPARPPEDGV